MLCCVYICVFGGFSIVRIRGGSWYRRVRVLVVVVYLLYCR